MPRLNRTGEAYDLLVAMATTSRTIGLKQVRGSKTPSKIKKQFLPTGPLQASSQPLTVQEWAFSNGPAGAGWSKETAASATAGGSEMGVVAGAWMRRDGVAQPPGEITEVALPVPLASTTGAVIYDSAEVGSAQDLFVSTFRNYVVTLTNGIDAPALTTFAAGIRTLFFSQFS